MAEVKGKKTVKEQHIQSHLIYYSYDQWIFFKTCFSALYGKSYYTNIG